MALPPIPALIHVKIFEQKLIIFANEKHLGPDVCVIRQDIFHVGDVP